MINVRIEDHPAFYVAGEKTYITGQDNSQFESFWERAHASGLIDRLKQLYPGEAQSITKSRVLGVSRVENDPDVRAFDFWIAAECSGDAHTPAFKVPACRWAIFSNSGDMPMALVDAEIYAFTKWLPASTYRHARVMELEVYPERDPRAVEFWLPIEQIPVE